MCGRSPRSKRCSAPRTRKLFAEIYDVTAAGNFEGHNILNRLGALELRDARDRGAARRDAGASCWRSAPRPRAARLRRQGAGGLERLTIAALANAADAFGRDDWLEAAERGLRFRPYADGAGDGRLLHACRAGEAKAPATATDYANMIHAALALANVSGDAGYITQAKAWVDVLDTHYWSDGAWRLLFRRGRHHRSHRAALKRAGRRDAERECDDGVESRGARGVDRARRAIASAPKASCAASLAALAENMSAIPACLTGLLELTAPAQIVIVVPEGGDAREHAARAPGRVAAERGGAGGAGQGHLSPRIRRRTARRAIDGKPTAYVCIGPQCSAPVMDAAALVAAVRAGRGVGGL